MSIVALHVVDPSGNHVADLYLDDVDGKWTDPHGGEFAARELIAFQRFAAGAGTGRITLHIGTKHERTFDARLTVTFI